MSEITVDTTELAAGATAAHDAAEQARGRSGQTHLRSARSAMPGSRSVTFLSELGDHWEDSVESWAARAEDFAESLAAQSDDFAESDRGAGHLISPLLEVLIGGAGGR